MAGTSAIVFPMHFDELTNERGFSNFSDVENYCALYRIGIANYKKLGVKQILKNRYSKLNFCHVHISIEIFKYIKDWRFQNFISSSQISSRSFGDDFCDLWMS